jgi:glycopeptide antibiotics resistance protein
VVNVKFVRFLAWSSLAIVAIVTLAPIGFRPESAFSPKIERFSAFAAIGLVFALAYPRRLWLAVVIALGSALLLEALQLLEPSRHGRVFDAIVKVAGGAIGLSLGQLLLLMLRFRARR